MFKGGLELGNVLWGMLCSTNSFNSMFPGLKQSSATGWGMQDGVMDFAIPSINSLEVDQVETVPSMECIKNLFQDRWP